MMLVLLLISILLLFWLVSKFRVKFPAYKTIGIFICIYLFIGCISFIYVQVSPTETYPVVTKDEIDFLSKEEAKIWSLVDANRADEINKKFLKDEWSFEVENNRFSVVNEPEDIGGLNVVVQWRDDPDSKEIFAKIYQIPSIIEGIDTTNKIVLPKIEFNPRENQLTINDITQKINFYKFSNSSILLDMNSRAGVSDEVFIGNTIQYLNVPKHVTIIDEGGWIIYPSTSE